MKSIIHIGMPKTGTTALQTALYRSREYLLGHSILYPRNDFPGPFTNHALLAASLLEDDGMPRYMRNRGLFRRKSMSRCLDTQIAGYQEQVARHQPDCVIYSSESLFRRIDGGRYARVRDVLSKLGPDPELVAWLRKPSEHFLSALQQKFKGSHRIKKPRAPSYRSVLNGWSQCTGRPVTVHLFDRNSMVNGSVVDDFCHHYLSDFDVAADSLDRGQFVNESLSAESMDILARYRARFHASRDDIFTPDTKLLIRALAKADSILEAGKPRLKPGVADLVDFSRDDPLWLRDEYGIEFPDFDYARLERRGAKPVAKKDFLLEDLVWIDRGLALEIIDFLVFRSAFALNLPGLLWMRTTLRGQIRASAAAKRTVKRNGRRAAAERA
ncbi:hypothetical protein [Amaricoccus tamworthensis]|uniref:hypothetical protein n=1 Tax=Amaricoccus tamworthensis TaxID=57002 RepID=UPI003C7B9316